MHVAVAICKLSIAMCTEFPAGATMVVRARSADLRIAYCILGVRAQARRGHIMRMLALARYALCDNGSRLLMEVFRAVKTLVYTSSGYNSLYKNVHWKTYDDCAILCASFIRDAKLNYDKCTVYFAPGVVC